MLNLNLSGETKHLASLQIYISGNGNSQNKAWGLTLFIYTESDQLNLSIREN